MPQTTEEIIAGAIAEMTRTTTVEGSAVVFIQSVPGLITAAVAAATANGATAEQLQPFVDLTNQVKAKNDEIEAALTANVPPSPQTSRR